MPLHRRLPKRGFTNIFSQGVRDRHIWVSSKGSTAIPSIRGKLLEVGAIRKLHHGLKILGWGELKRAITVKAHVFQNRPSKRFRRPAVERK